MLRFLPGLTAATVPAPSKTITIKQTFYSALQTRTMLFNISARHTYDTVAGLILILVVGKGPTEVD